MQKVIIGANAVGTDKELEDLMNQLESRHGLRLLVWNTKRSPM